MNKVYSRVNLFLIIVSSFLVSCHKKEEPLFNDERMEEVCLNVMAVTDTAEVIYGMCETVEQMVDRSDEILSFDGVESVYADGDIVFIDIKDWGLIGYSFEEDNGLNANDLDLSKKVESMIEEKIVKTRSGSYPVDFSACILNATHQEKPWTRDIVDATERMFHACGTDVAVIDFPTLSFFRTEIYKFDLVFMIGHGYYSELTNRHWIQTSEVFEPASLPAVLAMTQQRTFPSLSYPKDEVSLIAKRRIRDGKLGVVYRYYVSQVFIMNSPKSFESFGDAVVFMVPCQSLMGDTIEDEDRMIDRGLADAFFNRGAGMYIGYDESNYKGPIAGMFFLGSLLSGNSYKNALANIPSYYRFDQAAAMHVLKDNGFQDNTFLTSPVFLSFDHKNNNHYVLKGASYYCPSKTMVFDVSILFEERVNFKYVIEDRVQYGFYVSKSEDRNAGKHFIATPSWVHDVSQDSYLMSFEVDIPFKSLEPDTKYFAWPYMSDGNDYNFGDRFEFTTNRINQVVPERLLDEIEEYIPVFYGINPPNVEGQYVMSPEELIYDSTYGYDPGYVFSDLYFQFLNQDMVNNSLDYKEKQGESSGLGTGAFISGEGDHFSVFFNTDKTAVFSDYTVYYKTALVLSGTKTKDGIKDMYRAFVVVEKSDDPNNHIIPVDAIRILKDGDGLCSTTNYFKSPSSAVMKQLPYNPSLLPDRIEAER